MTYIIVIVNKILFLTPSIGLSYSPHLGILLGIERLSSNLLTVLGLGQSGDVPVKNAKHFCR
jgi:hypothetical protein